MVGYVQQLITTADLSHLIVEQLSIRQLSMMKKMDQKFETLEKSIVNVFQLMVNLQEADVPSFCFVTPSKFDDGAGWFAFATNFRQQMKSRVKWKHYYKLYVCDEGPLLLPDLCEKSEDPEHDGITIKLPGWLMLKVAPLLYVVAKMLQLALSSALPLIPIPVNIPYFKPSSSLLGRTSSATKKKKHQQKRLAQLVEGYRQITVQANLEQEADAMLEEIHTSLVSEKSTAAASSSKASAMPKMTGSYEALKQILEGTNDESEHGWSAFKTSGKMFKVYAKGTGECTLFLCLYRMTRREYLPLQNRLSSP
jgi:hypothetical protein